MNDELRISSPLWPRVVASEFENY